MKQKYPVSVRAAKLIQEAVSKGAKADDIVTRADRLAIDFDVKADKEAVEFLKELTSKPSAMKMSQLPAESVKYLETVLLDGRFIENWNQNVEEKAGELGLSLPPDQIPDLEDTDIRDILGNVNPDEGYAAAAAVALAVVVGIVVANGETGRPPPVIDFSNTPKL